MNHEPLNYQETNVPLLAARYINRVLENPSIMLEFIREQEILRSGNAMNHFPDPASPTYVEDCYNLCNIFYGAGTQASEDCFLQSYCNGFCKPMQGDQYDCTFLTPGEQLDNGLPTRRDLECVRERREMQGTPFDEYWGVYHVCFDRRSEIVARYPSEHDKCVRKGRWLQFDDMPNKLALDLEYYEEHRDHKT